MGSNVIVDIVIPTEHVLNLCVEVISKYNFFMVGIHCSLDELEKRESNRKQRLQGLARRQFSRVHAHAIYDFEVDTTTKSPFQCAQEIKNILHL